MQGTTKTITDYKIIQIRPSNMFIYPRYFEDQNCRNGTDIGMFKKFFFKNLILIKTKKTRSARRT